jgi:hypothetical protein
MPVVPVGEMYVKVHEAAPNVQLVEPNEPPQPPSLKLSTIPFGIIAVPWSVSETVAVHLELDPAAAWVQLIDTVTVRRAEMIWN